MMVRLIEMMNLGLELLDAVAVVSARQFKSARGGGRGAINRKVVEQRRESESHENEKCPDPFAPPDGIDKHPQAEERDDRKPGIGKPILDVQQVGNQRSEHGPEASANCGSWQQNWALVFATLVAYVSPGF